MQKRRKTLSIVAVALCASLTVGLVPGFAISAKEPEVPAMSLGANGVQDGDTVYFGEYTYLPYDGSGNKTGEPEKTEPVPYRVLAAQGGNGGTYEADGDAVEPEDAMFLLSEYIMGFYSFASGSLDNNYLNSEVRNVWCTDFAAGGELANIWANKRDKDTKEEKSELSEVEQKAILETTTTEDKDVSRTKASEMTWVASQLEGDKVFLLSAWEVTQEKYGFVEDTVKSDTRKVSIFANVQGDNKINKSANWWLRAPFPSAPNYAGIVDSSGKMTRNVVDHYINGIRPALNLNRTSVLFTSPAQDGKGRTLGKLGKVPNSKPDEWKLTLQDDGQTFDIEDNQQNEKTVYRNDASSYHLEFAYEGATPDLDLGDTVDEVISAMVVDGSDNILYYGAVAQPEADKGTVAVDLPTDLAEGKYTLRLFSEQRNGNYRTDYASDFEDVPLTVEAQKKRPNTHKPDKITPSNPDGTQTPGTPGGTTPDKQPGSPDRPGSVDTKKASVPAGSTYEALVYGVTDPSKIQVTVSDPDVAGFTISSDPRGSRIQVFGKKEGKITIKILANGILTEMEVEVKPLGGSLLIDTKSVTIPAGMQYQIGLILFDAEDKPLAPEQIKALLNPNPYGDPINPELLTIRDSRTGSVVDAQILDNGHILLTAKNPPANPTAYLQIFYKGQAYSVKVTTAAANTARAGEANSQRLYWAKS